MPNDWVCERCHKEVGVFFRCQKCRKGVCFSCIVQKDNQQLCLDCAQGTKKSKTWLRDKK